MNAHLNENEINGLNRRFEGRPPEELLAWAAGEFGDNLAFACSFSAEDMVLLDLLLKVQPSARVFTLDTGRLPQETHDLIEKARQHYRRSFDIHVPDAASLEALINARGPNSFYLSVDDRKQCCRVRKVDPLSRALQKAGAWLTGLRREQAVTRRDLSLVEIDGAHGGILKINPLINWTEVEVWNHIRARRLPYNALHDRGFLSIGCLPCTRAVQPGEDFRAGRWWWEPPEHKECGLHLPQKEVVHSTGGPCHGSS